MSGDVTSANGTRLWISSASVTPAIDTPTEFAGLTWVEVGLPETLGDFGDESAGVNFTSLSDGRVRKAKGSRDGGTVALTVGYDSTDLGQKKLVDAEASNRKYAFKVQYPDQITDNGAGSIDYFRGLVMSKRKNVGQNNNVIRRTFNIGVDSAIVEVEAT